MIINIDDAMQYIEDHKDLQELINNGKMDDVYAHIKTDVDFNEVHYFSELFIAAGLDQYLTKIPSNYLRGSSISKYTIPRRVTNIEGHSFEDCTKLASITIPNGVMYIGYGAFLRCESLTKVELPITIRHTGDHAFSCCSSLKLVSVYDNLSLNPMSFFGSNVSKIITKPSVL